MSPPSEATASATPNVDTDSQATADNMSQETAPVNPLIDSEGHVQPIRLARNSDHVESATYGQDSAELSGTTTRASPAEERLGETSILGRSADSRPAPNSRPDFVHLGSTLFERYVEYGSSRLPSEDQDEEETTKSEDMENETDPNRLHDYIHELKKKMSEIQGNCDRAVSELSKYDRGHSVEESWMRDRLVAIRQSLQACSYRMSDWSTLRANWSSVNKFLRSNDCVFLSANQIPGPGIFAQMESELLMFAFASALWKVLFDPMLLGATPVECSILRKLEVGIKGVSPPMHTDAVNRWRADTYRAIAASEGYDYQVNEKSMRTEALIERLLRYSEYRRGEIGDACGERDKRRGHSWYLQERVLKPAAELATKMRFCEDEYFWSWKAPRPMMKKRDLERFEVFDLKSHCTVVQSENRFADLSDNDTLGKCLFSIFPALYKRGKAGKPDSVVSRGWAAVVLRSHLANWCDVDAKESPQFPFDEDDRHIFGLEDLQLT